MTDRIESPVTLGEHGRREWERRYKPGIDVDVLEWYCEAFDEYHDSLAVIREQGRVAYSEKGGAYQHPAVGTKNKARECMLKLKDQLFGTGVGKQSVARRKRK